MKLLVCQHGPNVDKTENPDRPLSEQGHELVTHIAEWLQAHSVSTQHVLHSGILRAQQTANILATTIAPLCDTTKHGNLEPLDEPSSMVNEINTWHEDTLIVSHQPLVSKVVSQLLNCDDESHIHFAPGSIACLEKEQSKWTLRWHISPDIILTFDKESGGYGWT